MIMNFKKTIIILSAIVVVLVIAAVIVPNITIHQNEDNTEDPITYQVSDYAAAPAVEIIIENENGELHLIKNNDIWFDVGFEDVSLNQDEINDLAYIFTHIETNRIVSKDINEQKLYGIDEPRATITTIHDNQAEYEYILGDKAPLTGMYYMAMTGLDFTFTVGNVINTYATISIDDIKELHSIGIPIENLNKVSIDNKYINEQYTISKNQRGQ